MRGASAASGTAQGDILEHLKQACLTVALRPHGKGDGLGDAHEDHLLGVRTLLRTLQAVLCVCVAKCSFTQRG